MNWNCIIGSSGNSFTLQTLLLLLLGQLVSFILALCSFTSSFIASLGVDAPITQTSFGYLSLAVVYGTILLSRRQKLRVPWYWYILLGFCDVQGSFLVNKAYQYSSITSVTLMDCWTIPWVIILTYFLLGTCFSVLQLLGAVICVLGLGLCLLSDSGVGGGGGSKPLLGDVLVVIGTVFYASSNVGMEFCAKKKDSIETLAMLGTFGFLVSLVELSLLEVKNLESIIWSSNLIVAIIGYTASIFSFYSVAIVALKLCGSTMFNLSLLTSDMWAVVVRIFFYQQKVDWLYFVAFAVVAVGLIIYTTTGADSNSDPTGSANNNVEYQLITEANHQVVHTPPT